jgi:predicted nucleotidyltransferase
VRDALREVLAAEPKVAFAILFGSAARGTDHPQSDVDVGIGVTSPLSIHEFGDLVAKLESAAGRDVDLVLLETAPPAIAFRVFRDGVVLMQRDRSALAHRKARAVVEYLDFKPIEDVCVRGALNAARRGR